MSLENIRLMRLKDLIPKVCMGKTAIYGRIKAGDFPKPIRIGAKAVAWVEHEVDAWLVERINNSRSM